MASAPRQPNLLFVFADQWRRQAVGCMGADPVLTPRIDAFAGQGTLFERAYCNSPLCTPSRASLITGVHAFPLGMMHNWLELPPESPSIAKSLRAAGYDTGYIGKWHLDEWDGDPAHGNAWNPLTPPGDRRMGFDFWYANGCVHGHFNLDYITTDGARVQGEGWQVDHETDVAVDYLRNTAGQRDTDRPFCLFVSYAPPHTHHGGYKFDPSVKGFQFAAPDEYEALYRGRDLPVPPHTRRDLYERAAVGYFGAVSAIDAAFGRLLDTLDELHLAENTLVVVSADHGEMLGAQGMYTKDRWYEESIGIPLVARLPGTVPAGRREGRMVSVVDYAPSLLGLLGAEVPAAMQGRNRANLFRGTETGEQSSVPLYFAAGAPPRHRVKWDVFPDEGNRDWRGLRTERYTYAAVSREQYGDPRRFGKPVPEGVKQVLIDNAVDPWQVNPIYPGQDARYDTVMDSLHAQLAAWLDEMGDPFLQELWI